MEQMSGNVHRDAFRSAYDKASAELREISRAFEQLCAQKDRVEKLMEALKPQVEVAEEVDQSKNIKKTTHLPHCTVVTRVTVL